ncbi:hypothetical protein RJ639_045559 [Escallonia herrerae]|uniref:Protein transport protein Sec61 subunit beta n=1 Tax=Escallonia herrerae TaxID=1293975 RepID=A0AA89B420_9ASTE|nr:hypothetical protein RJ639_045559 [Escallonia herrerae]
MTRALPLQVGVGPLSVPVLTFSMLGAEMALTGAAPPRGSAAAAAANLRRRKTTSGGAAGGASGTMLQFYTDDAPGLKISPNVVLVMSIGFIAFVAVLHVMDLRALLKVKKRLKYCWVSVLFPKRRYVVFVFDVLIILETFALCFSSKATEFRIENPPIRRSRKCCTSKWFAVKGMAGHSVANGKGFIFLLHFISGLMSKLSGGNVEENEREMVIGLGLREAREIGSGKWGKGREY